MHRITLERHQVWLYLLALGLGLAAGSALQGSVAWLEAVLWPLLALLLWATFLQVPLLQLHQALRDLRFTGAVLTGNFVAMPLVAWALVELLSHVQPDPAVRLGVLLVLLVPCTDWFITFTQLGRGDALRATAITPLNLLLQLALLPAYLWLMGDTATLPAWDPATLVPALLVLLLPLAAAAAQQAWAGASSPSLQACHQSVCNALAWAPVPLLAGVLFVVAATQFNAVWQGLGVLPQVVPVFIASLLAAATLARALARAWSLPTAQGRTLAFTLGTRNSFVVLPLALALPAGWEAAAVVIVAQSLVELLAMVLWLRWVPGRLFSSRGTA